MTPASHLPAQPVPAEPPAPQRVDALRVVTQVLPGGRIELTAPELPEGGTVEVIVVLPGPAGPSAERLSEGVLDILASLPPGPRLFKTPEEADRYLRQERDSWDKPR